MPTRLDARPSARTFDVEELVSMAWGGLIRVPHFQRDFRWALDDVRKLFDSMLKGYPIGSLLLWTRQAPAQTLQLGALTIEAKESTDSLWVVDGQQRLTSMANALHPDAQRDSRFALSYELETGNFVKSPQAEHPLVIPLPVIFNLQEILRWFAKYPEISDRLDEATTVTRTIRQFEVPAYLVSGQDTEVLQNIFDRMNNYGKRLSRTEIFSALNAGSEDLAGESLTLGGIAEHIDLRHSFGRIDNDTVLAAILARRGAEVRRDIRNEFTADEDEGRDAAYSAGEEALHRAVAFLQQQAGVPHISMLAYRYLLVVLARVFAFYPIPDVRSLQLLRRWYWQAAVAGPEQFRGGTPNAARVLLTQVVAPTDDAKATLDASVAGLLAAVKSKANINLTSLHRFSTNEAATKMMLCVWWAVEPRDPSRGERYELGALAQSLADQKTARDAVHYLLPQSSVPIDYRKWAAVRVLMPSLEIDPREVPQLVLTRPTDWDDSLWRSVLQSHFVTVEAQEALTHGQVVQFIESRTEEMQRQVATFLTRNCEWSFEDTPSLSSFVLDEDEDPDE